MQFIQHSLQMLVTLRFFKRGAYITGWCHQSLERSSVDLSAVQALAHRLPHALSQVLITPVAACKADNLQRSRDPFFFNQGVQGRDQLPVRQVAGNAENNRSEER